MNISKRLFYAFMSFFIIVISIHQSSFVSYAFSWEHTPIKELYRYYNDLETETEKQDFIASLMDNIISGGSFVASSLGAIVNGSDFGQFMDNYEAYKDYILNGNLTENVTISEDNTITFSDDLTAVMKQALIEYAEEVNGFTIYPTIDYDLVPASEFKNVYDYKTFRNIVSESGCIVFNTTYFSGRTSGLIFGRPFHDITEDSVSLVAGTVYSNGIIVQGKFYGTNTWSYYRTKPVKEFITQYTDSNGYSAFRVFTSWEECTEVSSLEISSGLLDIRGAYPLGSVRGNTFISIDGRKLKVFNSLNALKNYTTGNRSVYFGSGFYDTPGEIKVPFDELEKYIDGKYDKFFDDLKDLIGKETDNEDSLSEEDLEKLVDKILGSMNDSGNNDNPGGNTGDNSSILSDILSALSGYFESVLAYLDSILASIQELIHVETIKPEPDGEYDLSDMINDVWEDPQNGSQVVADSLSASFSDIGSALMAKFPFCIPNDLYSLFNVFANIPESRAAPMSLEEDGIQTYAGSGSAPRFELPLVIESFGVNELIIIDMEPFTPLSKNARVFLSLIFAVALMKFSAVVIGFINDAWG